VFENEVATVMLCKRKEDKPKLALPARKEYTKPQGGIAAKHCK